MARRKLVRDVEIWKAIPHRQGYEASNFGRVRSIGRWVTYSTGRLQWYEGKILRQFKIPNGYLVTHFGQAHFTQYIHQAVARAFLGETPKGLQVCHNNGIKTDNRLENLRFDTPISNAADTVRHGKHQRGERNYNSKLTADQVRAIRKSNLSIYRLHKKYGMSTTTIRDIVLRRRWAWLD